MNAAIIAILICLQPQTSWYVVSAFSGGAVGSRRSRTYDANLLTVSSTSTDTTSDHVSNVVCTTSTSEDDENDTSWATHALLFSSLSDGIIPNQGARSFLQYSLANTLLNEQISSKEDSLKSSVEFSPCNGPDIEAINDLETVDQLYARGQQLSFESLDNNTIEKVTLWVTEALQHLSSDATDDINIRVLYIPTASYALNPQSENTPGKQRQRARADGKKRRTQLLQLLDSILNDRPQTQHFNILATTLDLDDGSLKQPVGSEDTSLFPSNDKDALSTWHPHLIYFEGGNTFWLQHCIEKGDYSDLIKNACKGPCGAVYCGKSAGAIVAGTHVATATWKGWDDPSVVPGKETYDEWLDCKGFEFSGNSSFFPHMSDDWKDTVEKNVKSQGLGNSVYCLREEDACCVIGNKKISLVTSGAPLQ